METQQLYFAIVAGTVVLIILCVIVAILVYEQNTRAQRITMAAGRTSSRQSAHRGGPDTGLNQKLVQIMQGTTGGLAILKDRQIKEIRGLLVSAGYRSRDAMVVYTFFKIFGPIALLAGSALVVYGFDPIGKGPMFDFGVVLGAALIGSRLPDMIVKNAQQKRLDAIKKSFPDALDMLVICAEAGLSSDAAMKRLVAETSRSNSVLGEELSITAQELNFMPDRRMALENLIERVPLPAINAFVNTMIQAERYGTPLARAFKVLSQELRTERMMRAEEKAGRLPATMTVPMMIFILPALFIVLIGPAVLDIMDKFIGME
ncbi:type II secretion system F family protein [Amaricoccus macauensis]|uniref:type II secretion system F family protein n=1 Tax=Amaricoccus macauensis TaxID=57001 RepID=UPI003C7AF1F1